MLHPSSTIVKILTFIIIFLHINLSAAQTTTESSIANELTESSTDLSSTLEQIESTSYVPDSIGSSSTAKPIETSADVPYSTDLSLTSGTIDVENSSGLSSSSQEITSVFTAQSLLTSTDQVQMSTGTMETNTDNESSSIMISSATTVLPITTSSSNTVVNLTYIFIIQTSEALSENVSISGNETYYNVTELIKYNVNTSIFSVEILRIDLIPISRIVRSTEKTFEMRVETTLRANRLVSSDAIPSLVRTEPSGSVNIRLPLANGTIVSISIPARAERVEGLPSTNPPTKGEAPPGLPAQLGMGLGISFLAILVIAEIAFFAWRFGFAKGTREQNYAMAGL